MSDESFFRRRIYVLDANVLIHDPGSVFRFDEHDIFLPAVVLETLDSAMQGRSETARNAREVSRIIETIVASHDRDAIGAGLALADVVARPVESDTPSGRLFLEPGTPGEAVAASDLLSATAGVAARNPDAAVVIVSKDIHCRLRARLAGLAAEDYFSDRIIDDTDLLYSGVHRADDATWREELARWESWEEKGVLHYAVPPDTFGPLQPNEGIFSGAGDVAFIARGMRDGRQVVSRPRDYRPGGHAVWGITARNGEQDFALNLLMDPDIDFVSLLGLAGSGKTLLALAAGLAQCMDDKRYREIIMTRETISVGEDIGFLPGTEEEKMTPWMGALLDNLEVLSDSGQGGSWGRAATADILREKIKIRSLSFMRGRTFLNRYIIIDEAQNLSVKQMRTLITRAGPGTKIVCLGNIAQIDSPYLSEVTSGLTYVVDRFRRWSHSGHVTLVRGERSRLAEFATENL